MCHLWWYVPECLVQRSRLLLLSERQLMTFFIAKACITYGGGTDVLAVLTVSGVTHTIFASFG